MRSKLKMAMLCAGLTLAASAAAQVTFFQHDNFGGGSFRVDSTVPNFAPLGFNDRASSVFVERGRWEVCEDAGFRGRCTILSPGRYPSLNPLGFNNRISSARPLEFQTQFPVVAAPPAAPVFDNRRQPNEHLFEVPVHSVRAVVGPPEQRCWVERQQIAESAQSAPNVPGAIVGAIIGGVLGHQVGGGRGQDVATAGGAVAGAAIGANAGRSTGGVYTQDVQRCATVPGSARPDFWDVMYYFDGLEHRIQLGGPPPPPTLWVNRAGEPRM